MSYISFFKNKFIPTDEVNLNFLDNFLSIVRGYQVFTFFKTVDGGKPLFLDHHIENCYFFSRKKFFSEHRNFQ